MIPEKPETRLWAGREGPPPGRSPDRPSGGPDPAGLGLGAGCRRGRRPVDRVLHHDRRRGGWILLGQSGHRRRVGPAGRDARAPRASGSARCRGLGRGAPGGRPRNCARRRRDASAILPPQPTHAGQLPIDREPRRLPELRARGHGRGQPDRRGPAQQRSRGVIRPERAPGRRRLGPEDPQAD